MKESETTASAGMEQLLGLFPRWGVPTMFDPGEFEARTNGARLLAADLSKLLSEVVSSQVQTILAGNQQFSRDMQVFLSARQPSELMAAQSALVTDALQGASAQIKAWIDFTQRAHDCCSAAIRETVRETVPATTKAK